MRRRGPHDDNTAHSPTDWGVKERGVGGEGEGRRVWTRGGGPLVHASLERGLQGEEAGIKCAEAAPPSHTPRIMAPALIGGLVRGGGPLRVMIYKSWGSRTSFP